ncbi:MAG: DUF4192 family protein [Marmoricola sp.]
MTPAGPTSSPETWASRPTTPVSALPPVTVLAGRPPAGLHPRLTRPVARRRPRARGDVADRDPRQHRSESRVQTEGRWAVSRVQQFHRDGVRLDDADAARLLVAVEAIPTRDQLWLAMTRGNAVSHVALWTDMTKRAPDEVRTAPASLLAFGSWLSGDGAMAWCALDQVPRGEALRPREPRRCGHRERDAPARMGSREIHAGARREPCRRA